MRVRMYSRIAAVLALVASVSSCWLFNSQTMAITIHSPESGSTFYTRNVKISGTVTYRQTVDEVSIEINALSGYGFESYTVYYPTADGDDTYSFSRDVLLPYSSQVSTDYRITVEATADTGETESVSLTVTL